MKKVQPDHEIVKIDNERDIAQIKLPPDTALGGFLGISPQDFERGKIPLLQKAGKGAATGKNREGSTLEGDIKNAAKSGSSPPKP